MRSVLTIVAVTSLLASTPMARAAQPLLSLTEPPSPQPGECWTSVVVPPTFESTTETVEMAPAKERIEPVAARYEWVEKTVTVPAGPRRVVIKPAQYRVTEERVLVHPVDEIKRQIPARTRTESRRVVAATGPVLKPNSASGALCVVEAPTAYREESKTVVVAPARTEWVERPARYRTVRHRTLIQPAETALQEAPEHSVRRREKVLVSPAGERHVPVPAVMAQQTRDVLQMPARIEWRAVLCGSNAAPQRVAAIQQALKGKGYDPGRTDGRFVEATGAAMREFQQHNGLPPNGFTVDGLQHLGLSAQ